MGDIPAQGAALLVYTGFRDSQATQACPNNNTVDSLLLSSAPSESLPYAHADVTSTICWGLTATMTLLQASTDKWIVRAVAPTLGLSRRDCRDRKATAGMVFRPYSAEEHQLGSTPSWQYDMLTPRAAGKASAGASGRPFEGGAQGVGVTSPTTWEGRNSTIKSGIVRAGWAPAKPVWIAFSPRNRLVPGSSPA